MSYKSFYKKVMGERILIMIKKMLKVKIIYRKNDEGEFERDIPIDKIYNLNNSLLIVDEAHQINW